MARATTLAATATGISASMIVAFAKCPWLMLPTFGTALAIISILIMTAARSPRKYRRDSAYRVLALLADAVCSKRRSDVDRNSR